ncbi:MAG: hypothetical protein SGILL_005358, partial [Bacillariaceae sp.]
MVIKSDSEAFTFRTSQSRPLDERILGRSNVSSKPVVVRSGRVWEQQEPPGDIIQPPSSRTTINAWNQSRISTTTHTGSAVYEHREPVGSKTAR